MTRDPWGSTANRRVARLIRETVDQLQLDLHGLTVLTEAATGHYAATAAIAVAGGAAKVYAIAGDSAWGSAGDAADATRALAREVDSGAALAIVTAPSEDILGAVDVITNLGFVRPIDASRVSQLKPTAVVSLMCESWEVRPSDVDVEECLRHGIVVLGTNESTPDWPVFSYSGVLALRMLFEAGLEVLGSRVTVLGRDKFAPVIASALRSAGAQVTIDREITIASCRVAMNGADAIIVADYASDEVILGGSGLVPAPVVAAAAPDAVIIQFAGAVDEATLRAAGLDVWPSPVVPARRMARTFAALGPKPVIQLHAAGLRVGEAAARRRLGGEGVDEVIERVCRDLPLALPPNQIPARTPVQ